MPLHSCALACILMTKWLCQNGQNPSGEAPYCRHKCVHRGCGLCTFNSVITSVLAAFTQLWDAQDLSNIVKNHTRNSHQFYNYTNGIIPPALAQILSLQEKYALEFIWALLTGEWYQNTSRLSENGHQWIIAKFATILWDDRPHQAEARPSLPFCLACCWYACGQWLHALAATPQPYHLWGNLHEPLFVPKPLATAQMSLCPLYALPRRSTCSIVPRSPMLPLIRVLLVMALKRHIQVTMRSR